jgi:hypothetical protein
MMKQTTTIGNTPSQEMLATMVFERSQDAAPHILGRCLNTSHITMFTMREMLQNSYVSL